MKKKKNAIKFTFFLLLLLLMCFVVVFRIRADNERCFRCAKGDCDPTAVNFGFINSHPTRLPWISKGRVNKTDDNNSALFLCCCARDTNAFWWKL